MGPLTTFLYDLNLRAQGRHIPLLSIHPYTNQMLAIDPPQKRNSMEKENLLSYDNNIMLAAIISLLLVILFVLLLHLYAKWFLAQARRRSRTHSSVSVSDVFGPVRLHHHLSTFTYEYDTATPFSHAAAAAAAANSPASKGVDPKFIALYIPLFSYHPDLHKQGLECAICLSVFEEEDVGRRLPKCSHAFHVECIDMWLLSHSSCPVCRSPVVVVAEEGKDVVAMDLGACAPAGSRHVGLVSAGTRMPAEVVALAGNEGEEGNLSSDDIGEIVIGIPAAEVISRTDDILAPSSLARTFRSSSLTNLSRLHPSFNCSLVRILSRSRSESRIHPAVSSPPVN